MDYFDILLAKKLEDDRDPKVEGLSVTENGRYHEEGVVYDPVIVALPLDDKTITQNGTYLASDDNLEGYDEVIVDVPLPENAYLLKDIPNTPTSIATFSDGANLPMPMLEVGIEATQDLHGYDSPWAGGAGKNKLPLTVDGIKALNTSGTWSGDVYTQNNVIFTLESNTEGSVTNIKVNSAGATATTSFFLVRNNASFASLYTNQSLILSGSPNGGSEQTYGMQGYKVVNQTAHVYDFGSGSTFTFNPDASNYFISIFVISGQSVNNLSFKPMIRLATVSDSTYEPYSNICPISGWDECNVSVSGVNVWDEEWEVGAYNTNDGTKANTNVQIRSKNYIKVIPNVSYYWLIPYTSVISGFAVALYYDANKNFIRYQNMASNGEILTMPSDCEYVTFFLSSLYGTTYNNDISINYPSTDTTYHAYNGHTYTLDLDGTRYGGKVDLVSGVLTLTYGYVDMGTLTWMKGNMNTENTGRIFYSVLSSSSPMKQPSDNGFCEALKYNPFSNWSAGQWERQILNGITVTNTAALVACVADNYSTATDFKTAMDGVQFVYELATPQTIQLTPTAVKSLLGSNNVWADSGDVIDGEYFSKEE